MTDEYAPSSTEEAEPVFAPYDAPAGGWGALHAVAKALREQSVVLKGSKSLLSMNQPDGFDCYVRAAMGRLKLTVGINTKLNSGHLVHGPDARILPCLAR